MPLDTLRRLEEFARGGGVLIATRRLPAIAPGLMTTEAEQNQIREMSRRLFEGSSAPARFVTDENQLASKLTSLLRPDVSLSPSVPDIGFVHRRRADAEIYFLANTSNTRQQARATFRVDGMQAEWWDPFTGNVSLAQSQRAPEGGVAVQLDLEPYVSRVLVFTKRNEPVANAPGTVSRTTTRTPESAIGNPQSIDLSTGWRVSFGRDGKPIVMDRLRSWTDDDATRYFSGLATYERDVIVPESMLAKGLEVRLDFGEGQPIPPQPLRSGMQAWLEAPVREAAVVYVNERRAGSVWCPPYSINVASLLKRGENRLRIVVANTAINHTAGRSLPSYRLLNLRYGERFQAQDMDKVQPVPSGLLGSIRLIASER
jgi:hypothetical protein